MSQSSCQQVIIFVLRSTGKMLFMVMQGFGHWPYCQFGIYFFFLYFKDCTPLLIMVFEYGE